MDRNNNQSEKYIQEDEIDLRELFLTLWKKKFFIFGFTLLITMASILYVNFKPYTPIYKGKLLVEIGEVFNKNNDSKLIDYSENLVKIIEAKYPSSIKANIPKRAAKEFNNFIELISENQNKATIQSDLEIAYNFILQRHQEKTKFYNKFIRTKKIGEITISNHPINKPKKKLIVAVAFVTGFILSIFLVFFIDFIKSISRSDNRDNLK